MRNPNPSVAIVLARLRPAVAAPSAKLPLSFGPHRDKTSPTQNPRGEIPGAGRRVQCGAQPNEASNTLTRRPATYHHASDSRAGTGATAPSKNERLHLILSNGHLCRTSARPGHGPRIEVCPGFSTRLRGSESRNRRRQDYLQEPSGCILTQSLRLWRGNGSSTGRNINQASRVIS